MFTIIFTVDGESYHTETVEEGVSVNAPEEPTKENYTFDGWKNEAGELITFPYTPTASETLTAEFTVTIEYIESTGTQCINTGIYPHKTEIYLKARFVKSIASGSCTNFLAGCYNADSQRYYAVKIEQGLSCSTKNNSVITLASKIPEDVFEVVYNNDNNEVLFNGEVKGTVSDLSYQVEHTIGLFAQITTTNGVNPSYEHKGAYQLYACKIRDKETNTLLRDFIPAIDEKGVICLYDKVTEAYFYNQGSGEFLYG